MFPPQLIAHRLATVQDCDKIVVLDKGALVEEGNHSSLLNMPGSLYSSMWNRQLKAFDGKKEEAGPMTPM